MVEPPIFFSVVVDKNSSSHLGKMVAATQIEKTSSSIKMQIRFLT
jgi:hypothetical protein